VCVCVCICVCLCVCMCVLVCCMLCVLMIPDCVIPYQSQRHCEHSISALWESQSHTMADTWNSVIWGNKWAKFCALVNSSVHTINKADSIAWTPLHRAAHFGRSRMVRYLIQRGAVVNMPTNLW